MSCGDRCWLALKAESLETVNSPALRKPKNPIVNAAHSMWVAADGGYFDQRLFILLRISGIRGK